MQAFKDFIFTVTYGPNPNQNLDRTFPDPPSGPSAERGRQAYINTPLDGPLRCVDCHALPTGTNGLLVSAQLLQSTQDFKIPQLRNMYEKTGLTPGPGQKTRGYGFVHDGGIGTLFDFLRLPVFSFGPNGDPMRRDVEAFLLAFDTGTAPATGAQRTVNALTYQAPETVGWVDLMIDQDDDQNIDLVVKGRSGGIVGRSRRQAEPDRFGIHRFLIESIFANAESIADDAVCPRPQIEASRIAWLSSKSRAAEPRATEGTDFFCNSSN